MVLVVLISTTFLLPVSAYDFMEGGIYYNVLSKKEHTVSVTYKDSRVEKMLIQSSYKGHVVIPRTVTHNGVKYTVVELGKKAFCYADNLLSVTIPNTVRAIRWFALAYTGISSVNIPESVVVIEGGAFRQSMKIKTIKVSPRNPYFRTVDNVLFTKQMTSLIFCAPGNVRKVYTVPSKVHKIYDAAFACCTIYTIKINSNVTEFVRDPFYSLYFLKSINKTKNSAKRTRECGIPGWPGICTKKTL